MTFDTLDLPNLKQMLRISFVTNNNSLIEDLINHYLIPKIDKRTCLSVLNDYLIELESEESKVYLSEMLKIAVEVAASNIFYLINNDEVAFNNLNDEVFEVIVDKYFEQNLFEENIDHSLILSKYIKRRRATDIFDLLERERRLSMNQFDQTHIDDELLCPIRWNITARSISELTSKESKEFSIDELKAKVSVYYSKEDVLKLTFKVENFDDDEYDFIIALISSVKIKKVGVATNTSFTMMYSSQEKKSLIAKIDNFSTYFKPHEEINISLDFYFQISYSFSCILRHVIKNFYEYHSLLSIAKINKSILSMILKSKYLNVKSEDDVLSSVMLWINNNSEADHNKAEELLRCVNWNNISLDCLIDFMINESKFLLSNPDLQGFITAEFHERFKQSMLSGYLIRYGRRSRNLTFCSRIGVQTDKLLLKQKLPQNTSRPILRA